MPFVDTGKLPVRAPRPGWHGRFFHGCKVIVVDHPVRESVGGVSTI